eukprot:9568376-Karenia_brevis.AAC.1
MQPTPWWSQWYRSSSTLSGDALARIKITYPTYPPGLLPSYEQGQVARTICGKPSALLSEQTQAIQDEICELPN